MALWRIGRGWPEPILKSYLKSYVKRRVNFDTPPDGMTAENGWLIDGSQARIGKEAPGPPEADGFFERARQALINYDFSDPSIVVGHFDPKSPFVGRNILLEIKVFGMHFLSGVRVHSVRDETLDNKTIFGFRYDTLYGHIESGMEWFLLTKDHDTGVIWFQIEAHWRLGQFPNWWSRLGFRLFGHYFRALWRHRAPRRLRRLAHRPITKAIAPPGELVHGGDPTAKKSD